MFKFWLALLLIFLLFSSTHAQLVINEASNRNYHQILDEDGDNNDWIELFNTSNQTVNLEGWSLSDNRKYPEKWKFTPTPVSAKSFMLIQASGKDRRNISESIYWSSAVLAGDQFQYIVPTSSTSGNWNQLDFNDSSWDTGKSGFGYGDGDDETIIASGTTTLFIRKEFTIDDPSQILASSFYVNYDDGFVAYLNGIEIARSNVNGSPVWNTTASNNHEAGSIEEFEVEEDLIPDILVEGKNVLAIAAINVGNTSSDLTMIPYLFFGTSEATNVFRELPDWYVQAAPGNLHTNFKLKSSGERIFLSKDGVIVDSLDVDGLQRDMSLGRVTDGAPEFGIFTKATPGASNNTSQAYTNGFTSKPELSLPAGIYSSSIEVAATTDDTNAEIHYTLNGSEPTESSSKYTAPIKMNVTRCVRFRAFSSSRLPSKITSATYLINEDDYSLPVLSVIANNDDIFGNQGIFTRWQETSEIPAYMDYFDKEKKLVFHQDAGMQIDGGAGGSRSLPQHSFRMEPGNGVLGDGDVKYKLLHRRPNRDNYPSFYVRNGSNQYLKLPYKDGLEVTALGRNTYTYYSAYEPIMVYINGKFFGVYELREKINDDYLVDNYHMDIDSLDFLGVSYFKGQQLEALRGSIQPFLDDVSKFSSLNTADDDYLQDVNQFLDIESYTDYIIAESWVGNNDWPFNNIKLFRCSSTKYRWQWAINDLEWALNPNGWTSSSFDHIQYMLSQGTGNYYTGFWNRMMNNAEYKAYFVNRFADLMNTSYDFSVIGPLENDMFNEINAEMDHEYERWGNSNINSQMNSFQNNHEIFRSELSKRSDFVRDDLKNHFNLHRKVNVTLDVEPKGAGSIQISTITPTNYPWTGIYFGGVDVQVKAIPNIGYEFVNWDPSSFITDVSSAIVTGEFKSTNARLKAYFRETNEDKGGVVISEINYKSAADEYLPDWIEICNYSHETVPMKGWHFTDSDTSHQFVIAKDIDLVSGERLVVCNNLDLFHYLYPGVDVYGGEFDFGLGTPNDEIKLYNANDSLVFRVDYSDNYPWPLSGDQFGRTLELRSATGNYSSASSWFKGCIGGSPGTEYQFCDEHVDVPDPIAFNQLELSVYPNPVYDYMNVEFKLEQEAQNCIISVYSATGRMILSKDIETLEAGNHHFTLDMKGVKRQLLLVKLTAGQNQKLVKVLKAE